MMADGRLGSTGNIKQYLNHQPTTKLKPSELVELSAEVQQSMEWHGVSPTISRYVTQPPLIRLCQELMNRSMLLSKLVIPVLTGTLSRPM